MQERHRCDYLIVRVNRIIARGLFNVNKAAYTPSFLLLHQVTNTSQFVLATTPSSKDALTPIPRCACQGLALYRYIADFVHESVSGRTGVCADIRIGIT